MTGAPGLRILVINWLDRENPTAGGAEIHLHRVFGGLARRGHDVTLLCSGWAGARVRTELDGMAVHRSGRRYTFGVTAPLDYGEWLGDAEFDVVVEDLNKVPLFSRLWTRAGVHTAVVHHLFGSTAFEAANPLVAAGTWLMERPIPLLLRGLPCVAVSESTRDDLVGRGVAPDLITVIPNGVDLEAALPGEERFPTPTALYLGRLKRYKRIDLLLRAADALRQRGVQMEVLIAGRGDDRDRLESLSRELGLDGRVRFLGHVSEEEKQRLFARSWVHVYPSPKEGWGIANVEAAAAGTPSIASDSPGLRDSVRDGETGLLVKHGDVEALASALESLAEPSTRDRLGKGARAFAERLDWDRVVDEFEEWLTEVARG